jgi:hypothetical protein
MVNISIDKNKISKGDNRLLLRLEEDKPLQVMESKVGKGKSY